VAWLAPVQVGATLAVCFVLFVAPLLGPVLLALDRRRVRR
jgi:hypothetical protein